MGESVNLFRVLGILVRIAIASVVATADVAITVGVVVTVDFDICRILGSSGRAIE